MTDGPETSDISGNPFGKALFDLTVAELRRTRQWEFLASLDGAKFRLAFDPKEEMWFLVVNGRDAPARFPEQVVKDAVEAAKKRPKN